jgi:hypothetical protein
MYTDTLSCVKFGRSMRTSRQQPDHHKAPLQILSNKRSLDDTLSCSDSEATELELDELFPAPKRFSYQRRLSGFDKLIFAAALVDNSSECS